MAEARPNASPKEFILAGIYPGGGWGEVTYTGKGFMHLVDNSNYWFSIDGSILTP